MGSYAHIDHYEVKFSGHLAAVAAGNGIKLEGGFLSLDFSQVSFLIIEIANRLDRLSVKEMAFHGDIQGMRKHARALQDIEALLFWLNKNDRDTFLNFG